MDFEVFSEPRTLTFKMDNIVRISYQVNSLTINDSCSILLIFHDDKDDRFYKQIILSGDDYKNWKDDQYIIDYIKDIINKMTA